MVVGAPRPAVLVVDRHPGMAADGVVAARRDQGKAGHDPLGDAPVVLALAGVAPRPDVQPARRFHHLEVRPQVLEVVLVAFRSLEQGIDAHRVPVQEGDMARVDAAFHRLQVVALLPALGHEAMAVRDHRPLVLGERRLVLRRAHVRPQHPAALHQRVGLELDPRAKLRVVRLGRDLDALTRDVVLPAVIRAAQPVLLVPSEPERDPAMRAELVHQPEAVLAVSPGDQPLGKQLHPHRRAIALRQLGGEQGRQPVAPEQLPQRRAGAGARQQFILVRAHQPALFDIGEPGSAIRMEFTPDCEALAATARRLPGETPRSTGTRVPRQARPVRRRRAARRSASPCSP